MTATTTMTAYNISIGIFTSVDKSCSVDKFSFIDKKICVDKFSSVDKIFSVVKYAVVKSDSEVVPEDDVTIIQFF